VETFLEDEKENCNKNYRNMWKHFWKFIDSAIRREKLFLTYPPGFNSFWSEIFHLDRGSITFNPSF